MDCGLVSGPNRHCRDAMLWIDRQGSVGWWWMLASEGSTAKLNLYCAGDAGAPRLTQPERPQHGIFIRRLRASKDSLNSHPILDRPWLARNSGWPPSRFFAGPSANSGSPACTPGRNGKLVSEPEAPPSYIIGRPDQGHPV